MTTYYLSSNVGTGGVSITQSSGVTEGTSAPSPVTDVLVTIGAGPAVANLSRSMVCDILEGILNYIRSDGAPQNGAAVIPFGRA